MSKLPASVADLTERHRSEAGFHDRKYTTGDSVPRHYRVDPTYPVFERMMSLLGDNLSGQRALEYGCGTGWITTQLAERGASVAAFDISPEAVAQTRAALAARNLQSRCEAVVMPGERLAYPDNSFDVAVGFAILHHLDLPLALSQLRRVLKPGGRAFFAEPLASNPLIRAYRRLTPRYRTPDETPIDLLALRAQLRSFSRFEHHDQLLLASAALACCYVPGLTGLTPSLQRLLMRVDDRFLKLMPWAGQWAWYTILVIEK
jgi:SAM-dependent methyltransferase